jgi:hypothetical protein
MALSLPGVRPGQNRVGVCLGGGAIHQAGRCGPSAAHSKVGVGPA